jgi:hypothetical protein
LLLLIFRLREKERGELYLVADAVAFLKQLRGNACRLRPALLRDIGTFERCAKSALLRHAEAKEFACPQCSARSVAYATVIKDEE